MGLLRRDPAVAAELIPTRYATYRGTAKPQPSMSLAMKQSVIFAGLNIHAALEAMMPADFYRIVDGVKVPVPPPPVAVHPSDFGIGHPETLAEWLYARRLGLKGSGNYFAEIVAKDSLGLPAKFQPIPIEDVRLKVRNHQIVEWKFGKTVMDADRVWHERGMLVPGNPVGINALAQAMMDVEVIATTKQYLSDWFGNSAIPGGILRHKSKTLSDKQRTSVKAKYDSSVTNGEVLVTGADWEWIGTQAKAAESGFLEAMNATHVDLCRFVDTPANLIDVPVSGGAVVNYANVTQKNLDYLVMRKGPDLKRTNDALTSLTARPRFARLNQNAVLAMDPLTAAQLMSTQIGAKLRAPSELRGSDDYAPFSDEQFDALRRLGLIPTTGAP